MKPKQRRSSKKTSRAGGEQREAELIFFTGKGGVGKTTLAASYACWRAQRDRKLRVLLLSTDPAHSLADVFEHKLPRKQTAIAISNFAKLTAHQVDAEHRFAAFLDQYREPLIAAIESGTVFTRDEIEPLLSSTLPGMAEMAALLAIDDALSSEKFDCIVIDTAPFGHTLRLFQLPEAFQKLLRFLEVASNRDAVLAAHFGGRKPAPNPLIAEWQQILNVLLVSLRSRARMFLVTTPEPFALEESARVAKLMRELSPPLKFSEIILNRVIASQSRCDVCRAKHSLVKPAQRFLKQHFPGARVSIARDPGMPILGPDQLTQFGQQVFGGAASALQLRKPPRSAKPRLKVTPWPIPKQRLSITVGKGGVGKTTISAALAVRLREAKPRVQVAVCSTDPAPSLDDVFKQPVGDSLAPVAGDRLLLAAEVDAAAEFHAWAARMKDKIAGALTASSGGLHVDLSFERLLFEALLDIVPPGLDEIFGVLRLSAMLRQKPATRLILDMAPTGHALELLRTPERILHWARLLLKSLAVHRTLPFARDLGAEIAQFASDVRWLSGRMRSAEATSAWIVMLAEPLPDRETLRLMKGLYDLEISIAGVFVNRMLYPAPKCKRCRVRAQWQWHSLARFQQKAPQQTAIFCLEEQAGGVAGRSALQSFSEKAWEAVSASHSAARSGKPQSPRKRRLSAKSTFRAD